MYWSLAGLDEETVLRLFEEVRTILTRKGIFIFDVENSEGIKENLIDSPFIDSFFLEEDGKTAVIRANYSRKTLPISWTGTRTILSRREAYQGWWRTG